MNNNIHTFTAGDIEKYHKGLLSNTERHDLEKAALDDPFLADALEGYAVPGVNVMADMTELKNRLGDKIAEEEEAKVIPIAGKRKTGFPWFRAAAAVIIIGGAAIFANQFLFTKKQGGLAKVETKTEKASTPTGTDTNTTISKSPETKNSAATTTTSGATSNAPEKLVEDGNPAADRMLDQDVKSNQPLNNNAVTGGTSPGSNVVTNEQAKSIAPVATSKEEVAIKRNEGDTKDLDAAKGYVNRDKNEVVKKQTNNGVVTDNAKFKQRSNQDSEAFVIQNNNAAGNRRMDDQYRNQQSNIFRGRVTDANGIGVPFANVTNTEDKVGTYTDANGNFNLTSPDTALTVQVRSIGFENNQVQLRNQPANQVVMQDDRRSLSEVVVSNQKPNVAARNRDANRTLQEPQPADGWDKYDAYLANNLEMPDDLKTKQSSSGSVQISFEVDKSGEPTNIRVEKSLCTKCDQEAIRLIKEGPKWKRAANKKGRTTVTINF